MNVISLKKKKKIYFMQNYITLQKISLIFSNQLRKLHPYPKTSTKSVGTVIFGKKLSQGSSFEKDKQINSTFSIAMSCCDCSASQNIILPFVRTFII